jgi:hypothetical protein
MNRGAQGNELKLIFQAFKIVAVNEFGGIDVLLDFALHLINGGEVDHSNPHERCHSAREACCNQETYDKATL